MFNKTIYLLGTVLVLSVFAAFLVSLPTADALLLGSEVLVDDFLDGVIDPSIWFEESGTWTESGGSIMASNPAWNNHIYNNVDRAAYIVKTVFFVDQVTGAGAGISLNYDSETRFGNVVYINPALNKVLFGDIQNGTFVSGSAVSLFEGQSIVSGEYTVQARVLENSATIFVTDSLGIQRQAVVSLDRQSGGTGLWGNGGANPAWRNWRLLTGTDVPPTIISHEAQQFLDLTRVNVTIERPGIVELLVSSSSDFSSPLYQQQRGSSILKKNLPDGPQTMVMFYDIPSQPGVTYYYKVSAWNVLKSLAIIETGSFVGGEKAHIKSLTSPVQNDAIRHSIAYIPETQTYVMGMQRLDEGGRPNAGELVIRTSSDGIIWSEESPIIHNRAPGQGDMTYIDGALYWFHWHGSDGNIDVMTTSDLANVADPSVWTHHDNVIQHIPGTFSDVRVYGASVLRNADGSAYQTASGDYVVYFGASDGSSAGGETIAFETTTDLTNPVAYNNRTAILHTPTASEDYSPQETASEQDSASISVPMAWYNDGTFYLTYQGWNGDRIGSVGRADEDIMLITNTHWGAGGWQQWGTMVARGGDPDFGDGALWDLYAASNPAYVFANGEARLYYYGIGSDALTTLDGDIGYTVLNPALFSDALSN